MYTVIGRVDAGFADPVHDAQTVFRATLEAMARPGRIIPAPALLHTPAPLTPVAGAIALTLVDADTPIWLDPILSTAAVEDYLRFNTGAPITADASKAAFAFVADLARLPDFDEFGQGDPEYPDRSATLVLQVEGLAARRGVTFTGPGIETAHMLDVAPLDADFWREVARNRANLPLGLDFVFAGPAAVAACPRATAIEL